MQFIPPHYNTELKIRPMRPEELMEARGVGARAFNCNALDGWYTLGPILVGEDTAGKMVCCLETQPAPLWFGESQVPAASVGGVATLPAEHNKGYAGALVRATVLQLREQGYWLCPLWPFSFAYYGKFGWAPTKRDLELTVIPRTAAALPDVSTTVRRAVPEDLPGISAAYDNAASTSNCQTVRDEEWWLRRTNLDTCFVSLDDDGGISGYAFYGLDTHDHGQIAYVREINAYSIREMIAIVKAVMALPEMIEATILLPGDSLFPEVFMERAKVTTVKRLQIRVTDPAQALSCLKPARGVEGKTSYAVHDWIVGGEKPIGLTVDVSDGGVSVRPGAAPGAIVCTVNTFTRLFTGALTIAQARALGLIEGGAANFDATSDALLLGRTPFRSGFEPG